MANTNPPSDETQILLAKIAPQLLDGGELTKTWPLKGGISAVTTAFEVSSGSTSKVWVLRQTGPRVLTENTDAASRDFAVYKELFSQGIPIPEPLLLDPDGKWYVMSYIDAQPDLNPNNSIDHVEQMAVQLASIHKAEITSSLVQALPLQNLEFSKREPRTEMGRRIHEAIHSRLPNSQDRCLIHGDYWPGNILWREESIVAIVDWEEAAYGTPLFDLGVARLDVLWAYGEAALSHFTDSYFRQNPIDQSDLPYWDLRACYRCDGLFAEFAPAYPHFDRPDITADHLQSLQIAFALRALDQLDSRK